VLGPGAGGRGDQGPGWGGVGGKGKGKGEIADGIKGILCIDTKWVEDVCFSEMEKILWRNATIVHTTHFLEDWVVRDMKRARMGRGW
jgi:hypothetical protein